MGFRFIRGIGRYCLRNPNQDAWVLDICTISSASATILPAHAVRQRRVRGARADIPSIFSRPAGKNSGACSVSPSFSVLAAGFTSAVRSFRACSRRLSAGLPPPALRRSHAHSCCSALVCPANCVKPPAPVETHPMRPLGFPPGPLTVAGPLHTAPPASFSSGSSLRLRLRRPMLHQRPRRPLPVPPSPPAVYFSPLIVLYPIFFFLFPVLPAASNSSCIYAVLWSLLALRSGSIPSARSLHAGCRKCPPLRQPRTGPHSSGCTASSSPKPSATPSRAPAAPFASPVAERTAECRVCLVPVRFPAARVLFDSNPPPSPPAPAFHLLPQLCASSPALPCSQPASEQLPARFFAVPAVLFHGSAVFFRPRVSVPRSGLLPSSPLRPLSSAASRASFSRCSFSPPLLLLLIPIPFLLLFILFAPFPFFHRACLCFRPLHILSACKHPPGYDFAAFVSAARNIRFPPRYPLHFFPAHTEALHTFFTASAQTRTFRLIPYFVGILVYGPLPSFSTALAIHPS